MNFLGHLFFSGNNKELMYANLFGDTVKGNQFLNYPTEIQKGILLHRKIDDYIDHHPAVLELKRDLYDELPKISSVAIDLFFDHLLARNWKMYHTLSYYDFLENFYNFQPKNWDSYPISFRTFIDIMRERKWLNYYPLEEGLIKSCQGVSSRISFPNVLYKAPETFQKKENFITEVFITYMTDAQAYLADFT
jgi:acyl carrier protein phosphodiesterase